MKPDASRRVKRGAFPKQCRKPSAEVVSVLPSSRLAEVVLSSPQTSNEPIQPDLTANRRRVPLYILETQVQFSLSWNDFLEGGLEIRL